MPGLQLGSAPSQWMDYLPLPGTAAGNQVRKEFVANLLAILGDTRFLWLPKITDTTTATDESQNARTLTYVPGSIAAWTTAPTVLGSGVLANFNGSTNGGSYPDAANLTFGDAAVDSPFSIIALTNVTDTAGVKDICAKYDAGGTQKEYRFFLDASEKLNFLLYDDSVPANIGRLYNTALTAGSNLFVAATYDGSGASGGIKLYSAAAQIDDTASNSGAYVAMENKSAALTIGLEYNTSPTGANWYSGSMGLVALCAKVLTVQELWAVKSLINSFYGLSL